LAKKVLSWITFAKRPLTTAEICCALAVEPDEVEIDPDNVPNSEDLVSVCAGLVVVDQESAVIRLVHYTTQEYFERIGDWWDPGGKMRLATTCLTYLCFGAFQSGSCSTNKEFEERLQQHQFLDYAAKHWGHHARAVEPEVDILACKLLQGSSLSCAVQVLAAPDYKHTVYSTNFVKMTALHCTARFGLASVAERVLSTAKEPATELVNAKDRRGNAPLAYAAEHGHQEAAKWLLAKGASINAQGGYYGNALQAASYRGHEQIVEILLNKGADVNAQGGIYRNALQAASYGGHKRIVEILLDKSAEVNAQGGFHRNALQAASYRGHKQVAEMLLEKGANINAHGGVCGNALQAALEEGHEQIAKMLLGKDVNVNAQGGDFGNALQAASYRGHKQVVEMLLEKGAYINVHGGVCGNALQAASARGHEQVVKMLLNQGAVVNEQGGYYGNALQAASVGGYEQIMKLLLEKDARDIVPETIKQPHVLSDCHMQLMLLEQKNRKRLLMARASEEQLSRDSHSE
jgi:ankyrin repeat protein